MLKLREYPRRLPRARVLGGRLGQLRRDQAPQSGVARHPEDVVDPLLLLGPVHQLVAAEAAVAAQDDVHLAPSGANLFHDPLDLGQAPVGRIPVGFPQPHTQQVFAGEDVQRQVAVLIVVAVEEAPLLLAVQFHVGGVQVEHDLRRRRLEGFQKNRHQQGVQAVLPVGNLLVAMRAAVAQFQPVQGALAGQRFVQLRLAGQNVQQRILPELLVVVEILVAQRQRIDALSHHFGDRVLDPLLARPSMKHPARRPSRLIWRSVWRSSRALAVSRHLAGGETGFHAPRKMGCKRERFFITLVIRKAASARQKTTSQQRNVVIKEWPFQHFFNYLTTTRNSLVRNAG